MDFSYNFTIRAAERDKIRAEYVVIMIRTKRKPNKNDKSGFPIYRPFQPNPDLQGIGFASLLGDQQPFLVILNQSFAFLHNTASPCHHGQL